MNWELLGLGFIAATNLVAALITWRTHTKVVAAASDILRVEKATNSMKDALVAATAKASRAEGVVAGRAEDASNKAAAAAGPRTSVLRRVSRESGS